MIRPTAFGFNLEAFETNSFQNEPEENTEAIQNKALIEFNSFAESLSKVGVNVTVIDDLEDSKTPDSIFPNNWFTTHRDRRMFLYPMAVPNRRAERREDIIAGLKNTHGYEIEDLSFYENDISPKFLEGTGSLIFDHDNKVVYAAISPRTSEELVTEVAENLGYRAVTFNAYGKESELIYHTNVMMSGGSNFIAVGLETVDSKDRENVLNHIKSSGKKIIELSNDQVYNTFVGNIIQLKNTANESVLVISKLAYGNLTKEQQAALHKLNDHIVQGDIPTIESIGGGSVRCMIAELF
jgi:hypothetical protein